MADLSRKEESLVAPIVAEIAKEPGLPARDLAALIHRNMSVTLRVVHKLVEVGVVERRQVWRVRSDRHERGYSGLYLAEGRKPVALDDEPETMLAPTMTRAAPELDPARIQLRELGERLRWGRLPLTQGETRGTAFLPGRAISAGEESWQRALDELSDEDVVAALGAGRRLTALLGA